MGKGVLIDTELKILNQNSNVIYATESRIIYSPTFKLHFIEEYQNGKRPGIIFKEAGLDPKMLGNKRIERASERWRKAYAVGNLSTYDDGYLRHQDAEQQKEERHKEAERTVKKLMKQMQFLEEKLAKKDEQIIELKNRLRVFGEI